MGMAEQQAGRTGGPWIAFLAMCFAVVGLVGLFASFATPLPLERALARDEVLDEVLALSAQPHPEAALEALRPRLDDSAGAVLPPGGDMQARVAGERAAMRARFRLEADATAARVRLMIGIVTVMAAVFGAAILRFARQG
jgi:hypothetical protein